MSGDVFEEDPSQGRSKLSDAAGNVWPEVALVVFAVSLASMAEGLAGVSSEQCVDASCERPGVERGDVIPDRGVCEVSGPHSGDEGFAGVLLPLDIGAGVEARLCEHEAHIQSTTACAEGQSVSGTWHHVMHPLQA